MAEGPTLLDLFCGGGGCAVGYRRAGFGRIVGVDIKPQPRYPFEFVQADAMELMRFGQVFPAKWPPLRLCLLHGGKFRCGEGMGEGRDWYLDDFDVIHASPPCQRFSNATRIHGIGNHKDLLTPTRKLLEKTGKPWVIENVPGAPMRADLIMCGSIIGERRLRRHRLFEFWKPMLWLVQPCQHQRKTVSVFGHGGHVYHDVNEWREVMGIHWMTRDELSQAIPPAYTEYIGKQLIRVLEDMKNGPAVSAGDFREA